jgi:hypothetical protein
MEDLIEENEELETESETGDEVSERIKRLEENEAVRSVLADPEIQKVLNARRSGKTVRVVEDEDEVEDEETPWEPNLAVPEDDDDPQSKLLKQIGGLFREFDQHITKKQARLEERLEALGGFAQNVQKKEVQEQVEKARGKFKDFKEYSGEMLKLSERLPDLNVEELYLLAKQRAGKLKLDEPSTHSEKPTHQPARLAERKGRKQETPKGRKGFNSMLQEALGELELEQSSRRY